jgi:FKBP-type peptidyl-prolyl cis-trans isomerase
MIMFLVAAALAADPAAAVTTASGLRIQTIRVGTGRRTGRCDAVLVTYEGRLANGQVFDASATPVGFAVSSLVPGFTEALELMNAGGRYRIWIPATLAYGHAGLAGHVPPDADLEFTVSLVAVGRPDPRQVPQGAADCH